MSRFIKQHTCVHCMCVCAWKWSARLLHACNDAIVSQWSALYVFPRMPSGRSMRVRKARPCSQYNHKLFSGDMLSFIQVQPRAPLQPLAGFMIRNCKAPFCNVTPPFSFCDMRFPVIDSPIMSPIVSQCSRGCVCVCCLSEFCLAVKRTVFLCFALTFSPWKSLLY